MLRDAAVDLLLGSRCVGCERPGRVLCGACREALPVAPGERWPDDPPDHLPVPFSALAYDGVARTMIVTHKERGLRGLRPVLGDLLALAVVEALVDARVDVGANGGIDVGAEPREDAAPLLLVPVPSRPASVRERGDDPTRGIVEYAARSLRAAGADVETARLLRTRAGVLDQAGLDRAARMRNLAGSMSVEHRRLARWRGRGVRIVVCDDVLTSGATTAEAARALGAVGLPVLAVATVAATPFD